MALEGYLVVGFLILVWIFGAFYFLRSGYHFIKMLGHFRSKTHDNFASMLVPWMAPFLPLFYTDEGNYHRELFLKNLGISLVLFAIFIVIIVFTEHAG